MQIDFIFSIRIKFLTINRPSTFMNRFSTVKYMRQTISIIFLAKLWMNNKYNQNHYLFCSIQSFMFKYKMFSKLQQRNTSVNTLVLWRGVLFGYTLGSNKLLKYSTSLWMMLLDHLKANFAIEISQIATIQQREPRQIATHSVRAIPTILCTNGSISQLFSFGPD